MAVAAGGAALKATSRLDNCVVGRDGEVLAVLDWELCTLGDPLADLGYLCMMWTENGDPPGGLREALGAITRREGFPTRAELIERYEQLTGRSMRDLQWYATLAPYRRGGPYTD